MKPVAIASPADETRDGPSTRLRSAATPVVAALVLPSVTLAAVLLACEGRSFAQSSPQDELAAAATAERSAQYEEAIRHYRNFLTAAASSVSPSAVVEARTRLATALFMLHRYDESLDALRPVIPSNAEEATRRAAGESTATNAQSSAAIPAQAWLVRGLDYLELARPGDIDRLSDATGSLRRALELNPGSGTARMALGDALARSEHLEEAAEEYRQQLRLTPDLADAWYKLGLAYTDLAGKVAADFAGNDAGNSLAVQLSAERLAESGDYRGAAHALYSAVHGVHPSGLKPVSTDRGKDGHPANQSSPGLHAAFGLALLQLGYSRAAEGEFKTELSQDPESLPAKFGMAQIEWLGSDPTAALATFQHLMAAYPKELARRLESPPPAALSKSSKGEGISLPPGLAGSAAAKLWVDWLGSAGLESFPRLDSEPNSSTPSSKVACSTAALTRQREPGHWLSEACAAQLLADLRSQPNPTKNERAKLAETEYRLGNYEDARASAMMLLQRAVGDPWARYWLAKSYSALAGECFGKLAEVSPDSARVHEVLAQYHSQRQQLARARTEYEAALRLEPELPDLHLGLGTVYWQLGDWAHAQGELKKALELSPGSAVAAYELGDSYIQQHQWQQAAGYLQRALSDPGLQRKAGLDLAKAEDELGNREAAIKELTLLAKDDRDGEVHYRLAVAYREAGDTASAQAAMAISEALRKASDQVSVERLESLQNEADNAKNAGSDHK